MPSGLLKTFCTLSVWNFNLVSRALKLRVDHWKSTWKIDWKIELHRPNPILPSVPHIAWRGNLSMATFTRKQFRSRNPRSGYPLSEKNWINLPAVWKPFKTRRLHFHLNDVEIDSPLSCMFFRGSKADSVLAVNKITISAIFNSRERRRRPRPSCFSVSSLSRNETAAFR